MKHLIKKVALLLLLSSNLYAQEPKKWTLEECIQYAVAHNIDIKKMALQKENAEVELNTAKMSRLPNLNAGVGQRWNFGRSNNTLSGVYENQTISNSNVYVSSNTPLFTGFKIQNQIEQNKLQLVALTHNLEKAKEDLSLNVASLFLQVLFNKELLKVNEEQLTLSQSQVKKTEMLVEVGKVPVSQLFDIKAQVAKDEVRVTESQNALQLSLLDLMQSLELERASAFDIAVPETRDVIEGNMNSISSPEDIYGYAVTSKPQIKAQESFVQSAEKVLKVAKSNYYPSLYLELGYGNSYFYNYSMEGKVDPVSLYTWRNTSFANQIKNNGGEYIGLNLNIPIFNRFAVRNQVQSARLGIQDQQLTLENTKKNLYKEIQTAYSNAIAAQAKYSSSLRAVEASRESFKYAEERYEIGKSTVFEFNEAKTRLIQSLSEQIRAKYDYIFSAKILDFYNGMPITL
jgi:outer membrane protein